MSLIHIGRNIFTVFVLFNFAATTIFIVEAVNAIPRSYIVEYEHNSGGSNYHHNAVNQELEQYNDLYKVKHVYSSPIFNGMSVTLNDNHTKQLQQHSAVSSIASTLAKSNDHHHPVFSQLRSHPVVKHIYPIYEVPRPQWKANQEDISLPYLGRDSQVNDIHSKLGLTGKDVLIGVLDSGVDYYHPALGGGFGEDHKIKLGKNLVSAEDDQENGVEPLGENDPYDPCRNNDAGHGTHVAGVIAGYYPEKNFVGIAPNASLGVFRIFGCEGGATEDTVIKAMEMAYKAGCKVINLSLGIENSWPEDAMSVVAERLSNQGVVVVGVAGNQGENGVYSQNSPATARSVISVASVDNSFVYSNVISFDFINDEYFSFATSTTTDGFPNGTIATITENGQVPFGCMSDTSITTNSAQGKILLVRRGACTFREKVEKAQSVGAIGVLFYDPNAQDKSVPIADTEGTDLPFAGIDSQLAGRLAERMTQESEGIQVIIPAEKQIVVPPRAGKISGFSSTGPNYELDLKPSITGIGGSVYSTLPLGVNDGWGVRSGTSMASPQVAGSAALLIEYQKLQQLNYTSHYIIEQLQNHGKLIAAEDGRLEHPVVQGAGLVQRK
ncbi:peptidase S8/S53 domain-containing protein [Mycotypha africana]|uniref:peptidase S8/S53 domain-containing protein n=1 Tax=Mycotypha africana TaxID=64632 RepID=UPI00230037C9|nr:peptidase S8/S53 domain-containing protein [Mycotypha africana]KAI8970374.1 peptidase S8/S53 domain-containing protein [Mycotypha africana]